MGTPNGTFLWWCPCCDAVTEKYNETDEVLRCWRCGAKKPNFDAPDEHMLKQIMVPAADTDTREAELTEVLKKIAEYLQRLVEHLEMSEWREEQEKNRQGAK